MTATALAATLGVTKAAVSQYEHDRQKPRPEVMQKICDTFRLPPAFFMREPAPMLSTPIFYRSLASATQRARKRVERRHEWVRSIATYLESFIEFPAVNIPDLCVDDPKTLSASDIEQLAADVRAHWGLGEGPLSNITWTLENRGAVVSKWSFASPELDAFSQAAPVRHGRPFVVLGTEKANCVRSRLDVAHELGHLLLHRSIRNEDEIAANFKKLEKDAFAFGAALLLPADAFSAELHSTTLNGFLALKPKWRVSVAAMIGRARVIGLIDDHELERLRINHAKRGWKRAEPYDDELPVESPQLLGSSLRLLVESKVQTRRQITTALPYAENIEELTGLEPGFLHETPPRVEPAPLRIRPSEGADRSWGPSQTGGRVIPFPPPTPLEH